MNRGPLIAVGSLGITAIALYVGATVLGGLLDPAYSHVGNAISELTGSQAPDRLLLAPIYVAYNLVLFGFGLALFRASAHRTRFAIGVAVLGLGGLSGIGQVTVFPQDSLGAVATTAGAVHIVLAASSSILSLATVILYGVAFRREPAFRRLSRYSFATAALLVLSAPVAVGTIGTNLIGLFERITIGIYLLWVVVVSIDSLRAVQARAHRPFRAPPRRDPAAPAPIR